MDCDIDSATVEKKNAILDLALPSLWPDDGVR